MDGRLLCTWSVAAWPLTMQGRTLAGNYQTSERTLPFLPCLTAQCGGVLLERGVLIELIHTPAMARGSLMAHLAVQLPHIRSPLGRRAGGRHDRDACLWSVCCCVLWGRSGKPRVPHGQDQPCLPVGTGLQESPPAGLGSGRGPRLYTIHTKEPVWYTRMSVVSWVNVDPVARGPLPSRLRVITTQRHQGTCVSH